MRWSQLGRLGLLPALFAAGVVACASPPAPTPPVEPEPTVTVTETFTNTLAQSEERIHRFVVKPGVVRTTVVSVEPDSAPLFGTRVGLWDSVSEACIAVIMNESMAEGTELVGTARQEAELCLNVYDIGTLAEGDTINYEIAVTHEAAPEAGTN